MKGAQRSIGLQHWIANPGAVGERARLVCFPRGLFVFAHIGILVTKALSIYLCLSLSLGVVAALETKQPQTQAYIYTQDRVPTTTSEWYFVKRTEGGGGGAAICALHGRRPRRRGEARNTAQIPTDLSYNFLIQAYPAGRPASPAASPAAGSQTRCPVVS